MVKKYIIVADDSIKGFDEEIAKLEREWGADELEPCEDVVSRKEVFETFGELLGVWGRQALMEMRPVTPKTGWILCSERLPEKNIEVLVTTKWGRCVALGKMVDNGDWLIYGGIEDIKIIAWMPLPQPYTAESRDKE